LRLFLTKFWKVLFLINVTASIVSIPKKGDLSNCNNYRGISLIKVGFKILSKIVTDRISKYAFKHNFIRPEQFGFRKHEECISLYISIRVICQRRKFKGKFTYVVFRDLKKGYDSVPIFIILTKIFHLGIRNKCFDFISNLYLTSKARARYLDMLSNEFPIHCGVRQGCPLSPILFNLFINDILNNCDKYGVSIGNKKCCGGLFADDIVLIAPSERKMKALLRYVFCWANKNEMSFGINKCATMVIKSLNFASYPGYEEPTFHLGMYSIPKASVYIYLDILFSNDLSFEPIITYMSTKVRKSLFSFSSFLSNNKVPLTFKRSIIQSYIISKVLYFAPLLGSNKKNSNNVQSLINTVMLWCINSDSSNKENYLNVKKKKKCKNYIKRNSTVSVYVLSCDLQVFPFAEFFASFQIKCFCK